MPRDGCAHRLRNYFHQLMYSVSHRGRCRSSGQSAGRLSQHTIFVCRAVQPDLANVIAMMVRDLLESWGLPLSVVAAFEEEEITQANLELGLPDATLLRLIPREGPRLLFLNKLALWKVKNTPPGSPSSESSRKTPEKTTGNRKAAEETTQEAYQGNIVTERNLLRGSPVNEFHKHLQSFIDGQILLAYYDGHDCFDANERDNVAERAILFALDGCYERSLTRDHFKQLAQSIHEVFPNEQPVTYFHVVESKVKVNRKKKVFKDRTYVQGKLRFKWYSVRTKLMKCGLLSKRSVVAEQMLDDDLETVNVDDDNDNDNEDLLWLYSNDDPWPDVHLKWASTVDVRLRKRDSCKTYLNYTSLFPALNRVDGWELLAADADHENPEFAFSTIEWSPFLERVKQLLLRVDVNLKIDESSDDLKCVGVLQLFSTLFKTRTIPKSEAALVTDTAWRPSKLEVQEGFFLVVQSISQIKEKLSQRSTRVQRYCYTVQPVPVIFVQSNVIKQCFVCVGTFRWQVKDPQEAVLATFKILFALDLTYPAEARHLWLYMQRTLFGVETPEDYEKDKGLKSYLAAYLKQYELISKK